MLHIKQCDDPTYLPFARNCIERLKATGVEYGSQKFEVAGVTVRVDIRPGADYVWVSGENIRIGMDSGVVDVLRYDGERATSFEAGVLRVTDSTGPIDATFIATDPPTGYLVRKYGSVASGLYGTIKSESGRITGYIKEHAPTPARSFMPFYYPRDGMYVPADNDSTLLTKKTVAVLCPASMFTGKTRLWVQAMYGLHLYDYANWKILGSGVSGPENPRKDTCDFSLSGDPPSGLLVTAAGGSGGFRVSTSSGVILSGDGYHWVCTITDTQAIFCRLEPSTAGASLKKYLRASGVIQVDVEAYILAESRPSPKHIQIVELGAPINDISLGYGYHWNWSGTAADIVVHSPGTATVASLISQHIQVTVAASIKDGVTTWTAARTTLETSDEWVGLWHICPILYPIWSGNTVSAFDRIMTDGWTPEVASASKSHSAPIYVYYEGDIRRLYRSEKVTYPGKTRLEQTEGWPQGLGLYNASSIDYTVSEYFTYSYKCNESSKSVIVDMARSEFGLAEESYGAVWDGIESQTGLTYSPSGITVKTGYPPYSYTTYGWKNYIYWSGSGFVSPYATTGCSSSAQGAVRKVTVTYETNDTSLSISGNVKIMIPAWDSQAVIVSRGYSKTTNKSNRVSQTNLAPGRMWADAAVFDGPDPVFFTYYAWGAARVSGTMINEPDTETSEASFTNTYHGSAGSFDAGNRDYYSHYGNTDIFDGLPVIEARSGAIPTVLPSGSSIGAGNPNQTVAMSGDTYFGKQGFTGDYAVPAHNAVFVGYV